MTKHLTFYGNPWKQKSQLSGIYSFTFYSDATGFQNDTTVVLLVTSASRVILTLQFITWIAIRWQAQQYNGSTSRSQYTSHHLTAPMGPVSHGMHHFQTLQPAVPYYNRSMSGLYLSDIVKCTSTRTTGSSQRSFDIPPLRTNFCNDGPHARYSISADARNATSFTELQTLSRNLPLSQRCFRLFGYSKVLFLIYIYKSNVT